MTASHTSQSVPTQLAKVLQTNEPFYGTVETGDSELQAAILPLQDQKGHTIGTLYMTAPDDYISTLVHHIIEQFAIIIAIILVFAIAILALFTCSIRKRLMKVTHVLRESGRGDFTQTLTDTSKDELGDVAKSYNQMSDNVKALMTDIQVHATEVDEVRNLVTNSKENANQINSITKNIQQLLASLNEAFTEINILTNSQSEAITDSSGTIHEINDKAQHLAKFAEELVFL